MPLKPGLKPAPTIVMTDNDNSSTPGRIEGCQFGVTPDGAATSTIPIWVSPGRRGIQPELVLRYHSRGGNGTLGVGWSLSGIPLITRCRKTIADDGAVRPIQFDSTDSFCLDGERLILVGGIAGTPGAEYRTKRDSFTKIILRDVDQLGPTVFEAFYKDGRIFTFGGLSDLGWLGIPPDPDLTATFGSRFEGTAEQFVAVPIQGDDRAALDAVEIVKKSVRYAWSLCSIRDRYDNQLQVHYDNDHLPAQIVYTSAPDETPALRTVDFNWEDRPDPQTSFMSGFRLKQTKRLKELRISGPDPTDPWVLRRYVFSYQNDSVSHRSLLRKVAEFDRFEVAKGAHSFEWDMGKSTFKQIDTGITDLKTTPAGRSTLPGRIRVADFNGDGCDDILYIPASDPNEFSIVLANPSLETAFGTPMKTGIQVPQNATTGRLYIFPDAFSGLMNILVQDDSVPTYRVYQTGIDRSGFTGNIGSFFVARGRDIYDPKGVVEGIVEVADLDGDGLPDLLHGDLSHVPRGGLPSWSLRTNLGGNLNFGNELLVGLFNVDHYFANLDGDSATALLIDGSGMAGSDPRFHALQLHRNGQNFSKSLTLTTLLQDQQYVFADFTGTGLPSAFSLGNADKTDPSLAENVGGSFAPPVPFVLNLRQPPSAYVPLMRVTDWDQDGSVELVVRSRSLSQQNDPVFLLKWNGNGFTQTRLPFTSTFLNTDEYNIFEVLDVDGDGLDDFVMFSNGQLRLFVRDGNKADMLTGIVDGLGARTSVQYAPISDSTVHAPDYGAVYPQRDIAAKVWVVSERQEDNGIGGVNTYQYRYQGAVGDSTGEGFLGFGSRDVLHVESGITTHTAYLPRTPKYSLLGLPIDEVVQTPLSNGAVHVTTRHWTYAVRPVFGNIPYSVFPLSIVEENVEKDKNGAPTMPARRLTTTQDMDTYGNLTQYNEVWSDGNQYASTSNYLNDPNTWLIGLLASITEQSTTPNGVKAVRKRAYEYDSAGLLEQVIIEPGPLGQGGYQPLGIQPDGVKTLFRGIARDVYGNIIQIVESEDDAQHIDQLGTDHSTTFTYDDLEHMFPTEVTNGLGHRVSASYHAGLAVTATLVDENGISHGWQYDGFGRLRHQTSPDGNHAMVHYLNVNDRMRVSLECGAGAKILMDYDLLGRPTIETTYVRDDGAATVRSIEYDPLGRIARVSRPRFAADPAIFDIFSYDTLGRLTARTGADGTSSTNEYRGEWLITTDGSQNAVAYKVDNLDRVVLSTDRDAALVGTNVTPAGLKCEYGPFDTLTKATDILGNSTLLKYDRLGRPIDLQDAALGHRLYQYDAFGSLSRETKGNNQVVRYHYDHIGRLSLIEDAIDGSTLYSWDKAAQGIGRLAQVTVPGPAPGKLTIAYAYDQIGRLATKTWTIGQNTYAITSSFDKVGRLAAITYPRVGAQAPFSVGYMYGQFGQLLNIIDTSNNEPLWSFMSADASGMFGEVQLGNKLVETYVQDPKRAGVLQSIQTRDSKRNLLRNLLYGFDANLNLQSRQDLIIGVTEKFDCDKNNRLHRWTWTGPAGNRVVRWDYDDIGNLQVRAVEAGPGNDLVYKYAPPLAGPCAIVSTTLGKYGYDIKGNQTHGPGRIIVFGRQDLPTRIAEKGRGALSLVYDGEMSRVRTIDEAQRMTTDRVGRLYDYRRDSSARGSDGEHVVTVWLGGRPLARRTWTVAGPNVAAGNTEYLHADHQGSIDFVTDANGAMTARLKYDPFGSRIDPTDSSKVPGPLNTDLQTGYTGHEQLDGWDLVDMKGRYYDPIAAKFLSADPFVPRPFTPQSWNRYAYVLNNPLTLRDRSGFDDGDDEDWGQQVPAPGETIWAPGVSTPDSCLQDAQCTETHVITLPPTSPPSAPPPNDDGMQGAGEIGPPTNAGLTPGSRGVADRAANDPAAIFLRLDRERTSRFAGNVPFGHPGRNAFHIGVGVTTAVGVSMMYGALGIEALGMVAEVAAVDSAEVTATQGIRASLSRIVPSWGSLGQNWYRLWHLLKHAQGLAPPGASYFFNSTNVFTLLQEAEEALPILQNNGNLARIVFAASNIGWDRNTGAPTAMYTVITDSLNRLVTMFPGLW